MANLSDVDGALKILSDDEDMRHLLLEDLDYLPINKYVYHEHLPFLLPITTIFTMWMILQHGTAKSSTAGDYDTALSVLDTKYLGQVGGRFDEKRWLIIVHSTIFNRGCQ